MQSRTFLPLGLISGLFLCGNLFAASGSKLPEDAKKALLKNYRHARNYQVKVEREKGKKIYEIRWKDDQGSKYEVEMKADGTLISESAPIAVADLPQMVLDRVKKKFPKGKIVSAEREKEGEKLNYEVKLESNGKKYNMEIEDEDDEDDDDDKDDD